MDFSHLPIKKELIDRQSILSDKSISWVSKDILLAAKSVYKVTIPEQTIQKDNQFLPIFREYNKVYSPYSFYLFNMYSSNIFYVETSPETSPISEDNPYYDLDKEYDRAREEVV